MATFKQTLSYAAHPLNVVMPKGKIIRFKEGEYTTSDEDEIAFLKEHTALCKEVKSVASTSPKIGVK